MLEKIQAINPNYLEYKSRVIVGICNIYDKKLEFDKFALGIEVA